MDIKITLFSKKRIFSGANFLYIGLQKLGHDVTFCCIDDSDPYNYANGLNVIEDTKGIKKAIKGCEILILSASVTLQWVIDHGISLNGKKTKIVIGDSHYCQNRDKYNSLFVSMDIEVFIMPDIMKYCSVPCKPYYPPFTPLPRVEYNDDRFIISHLPGIKYKSGIKGTRKIEKIVSKIEGVEFICQGVTKWKEAIEIKRNSTLYIDQLVNDDRFGDTYIGGLGKNGIEAMVMGVPTLTSGKGREYMYWITEETLKDIIEYLRDDKGALQRYRYGQYVWAMEHCTDIAVAKQLIGG